LLRQVILDLPLNNICTIHYRGAYVKTEPHAQTEIFSHYPHQRDPASGVKPANSFGHFDLDELAGSGRLLNRILLSPSSKNVSPHFLVVQVGKSAVFWKFLGVKLLNLGIH